MDSPDELLGESPELVAIRQSVHQLVNHVHRAGRLPPILIQGETGTGKGLLAHLIHRTSARRAGPFVDVNCAAIPESLLEAELFGFERGAFTDARQAKPGLFQVAHTGTLFLDEIGLLPEGLQGKLLKAIEDRVVRRLGSTRGERVDVCVVTASSEDLAAATKTRRFRADLYHRLSVVTLRLPPLRERQADILLLAEHFLARACTDYGLPAKTLEADALRALLEYPWPGNVRELCNVMERVALLTEAPAVTAETLMLTEAATRGRQEAGKEERSLGHLVEDIEQARILEALRQTDWNVSRAAARLRISRDKLRYRIEKYDLRPPDSPSPQHRAVSPPAMGPTSKAVSAPRTPTAIQWAHQFLAVLRVVLVAPEPSAGWADLTRPLESVIEKLRGFGGRVEEVSPQGIVMVFGLERGGEAVTQAALAALAIRQAAARAARIDPQTIKGMAAIHAGRFLVGQVGGSPEIAAESKREALTILDALVARADLGTVVVSGATIDFLDRRFALVPLDATDGSAFRLVGRHGAGVPGRLTAFVGRRHELGLLQSRLASVVRGQGQAVGIVGEPGIGKSRLLFELRESLGAEPVRYLQGHCLSFASNTPYLPIVETVRTLCELGDTDGAAAAGEKVRATLAAIGVADDGVVYLLDLLGLGEPVDPLEVRSPDTIRTRTFDLLRRLYVSLSQERPLILAVEDLHWIDKTSEEFLASLVEHLPTTRILFVATYRAGYRPSWVEKSYTTQIALPSLSPEESQGLLDSVLPPDRLPQSLAPIILAKAEGNPFFLEELARAMSRDADARTITVPDTIEDVLMTRIHQLPAEARRLLQLASVCGREMSRPLLEEIWDEPHDLEPHLRELVQREFVRLRTGPETTVCAFAHALTHEVAYRSLFDETRRRVHERVARALASRFPQVTETQPELLAHHYTNAGLAGPAVKHWLRAGQQARARSAYTEAISHLTQGLEGLTALPESRERTDLEIELQLALGSSLGAIKSFGSPGVGQAYRRAQDLAREIGQSSRLFDALAGLQTRDFVRGELGRAQELASQCLTLADYSGEPSVLYRSSNAMGGVLVHVGEPASAQEHLERAIALVEADKSRPFPHRPSVFHPLVFALSYNSWALWLLGYPDQALHVSESALTTAERLDQPLSRALAWHYANVLRQLRREEGFILVQADALAALASEHGFQHFSALALVMGGWAVAERGDLAQGAAQIRQGLDAYRDTGTGLGRPYFLGLLAAVYARTGRRREAVEVLAEAIALGQERNERAWEAELQRQTGEVLLAEPAADVDQAKRHFQQAIAIARAQGARAWELRAALSLTRLGGSPDERKMLHDVYDRFTEGRDTRDLAEAREFFAFEAA
ncbi:MAG TPA: sigma 54-interacting transcriptional regulator [Methylomirabilota bacterium]|nr:sigma 54-interacting transcriptional regulator [Methylomirabilota bacterium]